MWMTSEKAWPCQEGWQPRNTFQRPVVLLDCLLCICWPFPGFLQDEMRQRYFPEDEKEGKLISTFISQARKKQGVLGSPEAPWGCWRKVEMKAERKAWLQSLTWAEPPCPVCLNEVIPHPRLDRGNDQKTAVKRLPRFAFSKTRGGLGHFPPPLHPSPRHCELQGSVNWRPSKITGAVCLRMIVNDRDDQVYLVTSPGDLRLV